MMYDTDFLLKKLDDKQREAVVCDCNCVVSAGAGSGKTTVLAHRFVYLVLEQKAHVDEILTLTFSKAAAAEMHERIHSMLLSMKDTGHLVRELERFPNATISTIDSFCNRIVSNDAIRYSFPSEIVLDDEANQLLAKECALELIQLMEHHPGMVFLASHCKPELFIEDFWTKMAAAAFHPSAVFDKQKAFEAVNDLIDDYLFAGATALVGLSDKICSLQGSGKTFEQAVQNCAMVKTICVKLLAKSIDPMEIYELIEPMQLKKTVSRTWEEKEVYAGLVDRWHAELDWLLIATRAKADEQILENVLEVIDRYCRLYLQAKRANALVTFSDVAHMAVDILIKNLEIRSYYKQRYKYIMIDEFQDNNSLQKDLLYLLAERMDLAGDHVPHVDELEGSKLFFVGDEKQSIYRFRGADVSVFKLLAKELESVGGRHIELDRNYRSHPQLVRWFNAVFPKIMEPSDELYEASYSPLDEHTETSGMTPSVSLYIKPLADESASVQEDDEEQVSSVEAEAYMISQLIVTITTTDDYVIANREGVLRRPTYDDIAILYRTSSNQLHYEKALRAAGIPYAISAVQSLFLESATNDMYQMLQLIQYPNDRFSYVASLRSPFCRLSDTSILEVLDQYESDKVPFKPLQRQLDDPAEKLAYDTCSNLYHNIQKQVGIMPIANLVAMLWYDGAYRYHLMAHPSRHVYLEHGEYLLEMARQYDAKGRSLSDFIDFIRDRLGKNEKIPDIELLREETTGVRMMTIHKSKGLEFPIVILANTGASIRQSENPGWALLSKGTQVLPIPCHMEPFLLKRHKSKRKVDNIVYERNRNLEESQETAEMKRLLYVAVTRAESHLIITGCESKQNIGENSHRRNMMMLLRNVIGLDRVEVFRNGIFSINTIQDAPESVFTPSISEDNIRERVMALSKFYTQNFVPPYQSRPIVTVTEYADTSECRLSSSYKLRELDIDTLLLEKDLESAFGTWCHNVLAHAIGCMAKDKKTILEALDQYDFSTSMPKDMEVLSEKELTRVALTIRYLVQQFFSSVAWSRIITGNPDSIDPERSFACRMTIDGTVTLVYGKVDLIITYDDKIKIIDFKTDAYRNEASHQKQLALYAKALHLITGKRVETALCYLRDIDVLHWATAY